jgi:hypothetical protein
MTANEQGFMPGRINIGKDFGGGATQIHLLSAAASGVQAGIKPLLGALRFHSHSLISVQMSH